MKKILILTFLGIGCASPVEPEYVQPKKEFAIDSEFSSDEIVMSINGLNKWGKILNEEYSYIIKDTEWGDTDTVSFQDKESELIVNIHEKKGFYPGGVGSSKLKSVAMVPEVIRERAKNVDKSYRTVFHSVILHEFGHYIGLGHSDNKEDIMHPKALADDLSENDIRRAKEKTQ